MKITQTIWLLAFVCLAGITQAAVKLPALLSDNMVLQRDRPITIWGTADADEAVTVTLADTVRSIRADANGQWRVSLPALPAGGPHTLQVNDLQLTNILIGDVWLCSGQSNMELTIGWVSERFADLTATYTNNSIRHFKVPNTVNFHAPQADLPGGTWQVLTPDNAWEFSALAYFMAKTTYEANGIPVGIVNASWGGTPIEAWISEEALQAFPRALNEKRMYEDDDYCTAIKQLEGQAFHRWYHSLYNNDPGLQADTAWFSPHYDDSQWQETTLFARDWGHDGLNPIGGSHWLRKWVDVPASWAEREATLRLGCIVDADSVYVNGEFVGTTSYQYPARIYRLPKGLLHPGKNLITVRVISNGGQPSFVPEKPYKLICNSEEIMLDEGTWRYRTGAPMPPAPSMMFFCYKPVCLYNAMIAPLSPMSFKGVVWYQGESNVSRHNEYASLLTAMMSDWRRTFRDNRLPFYIVELADFLHPDDTGGRHAWSELRQQQARAAQTDPHATLIPNSDLGEWNDIHPLDKQTLGIRVARQILEDMNIQR